MTWADINVFQWQQLAPYMGKEIDLEDESKIIAIISGMTELQVDSLTIEEYKKQRTKLKFLTEDIGGKPVKFIDINGRRYKCIYDIRKINAARYIESKVYSQDLISNLHKIAASLVHPMKKTLLGWKLDKYDAAKHEEYSQDMLEAKFIDIYNSVVFFYQVYRNWMEVSKGYLIAELQKKGVESPEKVVADLLNIMDGSIAPNLLPTTKISQLAKLTNYR